MKESEQELSGSRPPTSDLPSRTVKFTLAYDGTHYFGWQVQREEPTIQSTIERALLELTGQKLRATASGRTDSGVHALGQVMAITIDTNMTDAQLVRGINAKTPYDIEILSAETVNDDFDPIRHSKRKRYRYVIQYGKQRDVFALNYCWEIFGDLDIEAMRLAAAHLIGEHDFFSFQTTGSDRLTTVRTVYDLSLTESTPNKDFPQQKRLELEIEANGFLYNMVRSITGTLVEVGRGKRDADSIPEILASKNRRAAGQTAPPQGLFLVRVDYDE